MKPAFRRSLLSSTLAACALSSVWFSCTASEPFKAGVGGAAASGAPAVAGTAPLASAGSSAGGAASAGVGATTSIGANAAVAGASTGGSSAGDTSPTGGGAGSGGVASGGTGGAAGLDVTFFVVADTHADPVLQDDLLAQARALSAVADSGKWPAKIDGQDTHFTGGAIGKPRGVVFVGDLTGWGTATSEIPTFRHYFEAGNSADSMPFAAYLGLGNHDVDSADRTEPLASQYRALEWGWIDSRHAGAAAPVKVTRFDPASHAYSFDFDGVHLVQLHRFAGDTQYGLASSLTFLQRDLAESAADGRPVVLFHHYGMDAFGTEDRWWTQAQRDAYRAALDGYHVTAIVAGHSHAAFNYDWESLRVFQINNAQAEIGTGNDDGNGSFAIVRITDTRLDVVTCRWLDASGHYELIAPFFSGPQ